MKKDYYEITLEEDANLVDEVVVVGVWYAEER